VLRKGSTYASRHTIIIDDEGNVRAIDTQVDVQTHGNDVLDMIEKLQAE
jgi:peroxiredoxin